MAGLSPANSVSYEKILIIEYFKILCMILTWILVSYYGISKIMTYVKISLAL